MPLSRTRSTQHKVYIPTSARENQYLMAKFVLTDQLIEKFGSLIDNDASEPYAKLYQALAKTFFKINDELNIENAQFIANDKFARVRFSPEKLVSQTQQQLLFLYNPQYHTSQNVFTDGSKRVKKIALLFLANGDEIRLQAANFHKQVQQAITKFSEEIGIEKQMVRVCDHQHLTYDLFAKSKGIEGTQVHKFRSMTNRYLADDQNLPENTDALTYAVVDLPVNRRVRSLVTIDENEPACYNELYNLVADAFITAAKNQNLFNGAVIANGLVPIVRSAKDENVIADGELLMLGYNPSLSSGGYTCKWDANKLVDTIQLIFVASDQNKSSHGYGKFVNQIEQALRTFAQQLDFVTDKEEMLVRLHQHIGFYLD
ncbi:DUF3083 family protein [Colwellia sp. KU-HH00111]|uniref:DUF3083 family protein n=1 Tax=Colwellia sp. KU-HH00111 TaxID=3127652 RepID=UPI003106577A